MDAGFFGNPDYLSENLTIYTCQTTIYTQLFQVRKAVVALQLFQAFHILRNTKREKENYPRSRVSSQGNTNTFQIPVVQNRFSPKKKSPGMNNSATNLKYFFYIALHTY